MYAFPVSLLLKIMFGNPTSFPEKCLSTLRTLPGSQPAPKQPGGHRCVFPCSGRTWPVCSFSCGPRNRYWSNRIRLSYLPGQTVHWSVWTGTAPVGLLPNKACGIWHIACPCLPVQGQNLSVHKWPGFLLCTLRFSTLMPGKPLCL